MVPSMWCYFPPQKDRGAEQQTKAKILWDMDLEISAKDFNKDGKLEDVDKVATLSDELNHVGEGTEASRTFKDAISLEEVSGEFILSFETDGSMSPKTAFMKAVEELAGRFGSLEKDLASSL